jgi:hypothetical protein
MDGLDDFLKGSEQPVEAIEPEVTEAIEAPAPEAVEEAPQGRARDEKGRFAPKGEEVEASPASEEPKFDHAATLGERRRRQEAEARLADLEAQLAQFQQQQQAPPPSIWDDEQRWQQNLSTEVVNTAVQQATFNARLDMSEMMARQNHADFEEKKAAFIDLMNETPGLQQKALSDPHPWNFAYQYVANHQRMQELSATNVGELEARLREQIKAELEAQKPQTPPVPETLADAQSARGAAAETLHVPSFNEILKR